MIETIVQNLYWGVYIYMYIHIYNMYIHIHENILFAPIFLLFTHSLSPFFHFILTYVLILPQQLKQAGPPHAVASSDQQQELMRIRAELEKKNVQYEEELCRRETLHSSELKGLKKELRDAEGQHLTLQKEILMVKDKLEKNRRERYMCNYM